MRDTGDCLPRVTLPIFYSEDRKHTHRDTRGHKETLTCPVSPVDKTWAYDTILPNALEGKDVYWEILRRLRETERESSKTFYSLSLSYEKMTAGFAMTTDHEEPKKALKVTTSHGTATFALLSM